MTTDTALGVTKLVVHDKSESESVAPYDVLTSAAVPLEDIKYIVRRRND